ncbi:MAG: carboxypeptidase-like regulatory domain-containing protein [Pyrinomonadaceae bacterium]
MAYTAMLSMVLSATFALSVDAQLRKDASFKKETTTAELAPTPIFLSGILHCSTVNSSNDPRLANTTEDWGLLLDSSLPSGFTGPYPFSNGNTGTVPRILIGGAPAEPSESISINKTSSTTFSWLSTRAVTAVVVVSVTGATAESNVYPYNPASTGGANGTGLNTGNANGISRVEFCFETELIPSAANATITGRILASNGRGISGARMVLVDNATGDIRVANSNIFGYYTFPEVETTFFYTLTVSSKRYTFQNPSRSFVLNEDSFGMDFVADN